MTDFNALTLAHRFMREQVRPGDLCIDATVGRGRDTALLCGLVGKRGRVEGFDIQQPALDSAALLLEQEGYSQIARLHLDSHSNMHRYAAPGSVRCITFNFGWLPGGDHNIFTRPQTSIEAIEQGLDLLLPDGVMSLCIYYGRETGYAERDALLEYLRTVDSRRCTVLLHSFLNRAGDPAMPVFLLKGV